MRRMSRNEIFIITPSWVDALTLASLFFSACGLLAAGHGMLTLAISLMLLAMLVDMADGLLARRLKLDSEFGRYLDSFFDVFSYLVLPLYILYRFGMEDAVSLIAFFAFLATGVLRLSRFNMIGTVEQDGIPYHIGLQVIWSQLLVVLTYAAWAWLGGGVHYAVAAVLLVMSLFMILNLRFPKPTRYALQAAAILSVTLVFLYLHLTGVQAP